MKKNLKLKIFIGYDSREKIAFHTLSQSIIENSSIPVTITPICLTNIKHFYKRPKTKTHSTEFSISRFLTPYLSNYEGYSLFLDCDLYESYMLCLEKLYCKVKKGGAIIFDEYYSLKYPDARIAVNEYFEKKKWYFRDI